MKNSLRLLSHLLVVSSLFCASVFADSQVTDAQIYQLMDKSGVTKAIESMPEQIQSFSSIDALTTKDSQEQKKFQEVFVSSLKTDAMLLQVVDYLRSNATPEEVGEILKWLDSDLAVRVVNAELQGTEPDFQQNFLRYLADLQANPPAQNRTEVIVDFVHSSGALDLASNMAEGLIQNMFSAVKAKQPDNQELDNELNKQFKTIIPALTQQLEQSMILSSYYIYRDLSNEELKQYSAFFKTELGKRYLSLLFGAIGQGFESWGISLINLVQSEEASSEE